MKKVRIPIKITGISNLGTWTITRFLKYIPNECQIDTVDRLIKNFSDYSNYSNWEVVEWQYPENNLVEKKWYDREITKLACNG